VARAGLTLGANHGGAFGDPAQGFTKVAGAAHERNFVGLFVDVVFFVGGGEYFALVDVVDLQRFEHASLGEMANAGFGHNGDRDGAHDLPNDSDGRHAGHAALFADVGGHALERHHSGGSGAFGDDGLVVIGDVHDDAALEHFRQADLDTEIV